MESEQIVRTVGDTEKTRWDRLVRHPLQSWAWGDFRQAMGIDVVRLGVYEKDELQSCWQMTFHHIPLTGYTVGYFPKGPKPTKGMVSELRNIARQKHAIYIQLEPNCTKEEFGVVPDGLRASHRPLFTRYTFLLDLRKSETELLASMHTKTRYNIKVAQKHAIAIQNDDSDTAFAEYLRLSEETTSRQGFFAHNRTYQQTMWNIMKTSGVAKLWTATLGKETLAAWILFIWNDTIYYPYGASSRLHKETMAPNLLLWELMRWAKNQGLSFFDLWGALGPNPDMHDPWYGFHRFKLGYNPLHVEFAGSFDLVVSQALYSRYCLVDSLRWKFLNLIKK